MTTLEGMHVWHHGERDQIMARVSGPEYTRTMALGKETIQAFLHSVCHIIESGHETVDTEDPEFRKAHGSDDNAQPRADPCLQVIENSAALQSAMPWRCISLQEPKPEVIVAIDIDSDGPVTFVSFLARQATFGTPPVCRIEADTFALHRLVMMMALSSAYGGWNLEVPTWLYEATVARAHSDAALDQARNSSIRNRGLRPL
jgi:hypothetical protein